eukprot:1850333-Pleurochrysis_carterae.AAC.1
MPPPVEEPISTLHKRVSSRCLPSFELHALELQGTSVSSRSVCMLVRTSVSSRSVRDEWG